SAEGRRDLEHDAEADVDHPVGGPLRRDDARRRDDGHEPDGRGLPERQADEEREEGHHEHAAAEPEERTEQAAHGTERHDGEDGAYRHQRPPAQGRSTAWSAAMAGVSTPSVRPRRTTSPASASFSIRLPASRSMSSDERVEGGNASM